MPTEVWTVHRVSDNHVVGVYTKEEAAATWCTGDLEPFYYYEHHEVIDF